MSETSTTTATATVAEIATEVGALIEGCPTPYQPIIYIVGGKAEITVMDLDELRAWRSHMNAEMIESKPALADARSTHYFTRVTMTCGATLVVQHFEQQAVAA